MSDARPGERPAPKVPTDNESATRIAEIRERWAKTTPGPWRSDIQPGDEGHEVWGPKGPGYGTIVTAYPCRPSECRANAIAIASAPSDIAFLLAALAAGGSPQPEPNEQLRSLLRELADDVQGMIDSTTTCGDPDAECPLQDAHKPWSTAGILKRVEAALARPGQEAAPPTPRSAE